MVKPTIRKSGRKRETPEFFVSSAFVTPPRTVATKKPRKSKPEPIDSEAEDEFPDEEEEIVKSVASKKRKTTGKIVKKVIAKKGQKTAVPKQPKEKKPKQKVHPNAKLTANENVTKYAKDPTFESKEALPFISVSSYSKLAIRAAILQDEALMKRLIADTKHVCHLNSNRAIALPYDASCYALLSGNWKLIELLKQNERKPKPNRVTVLPDLLQTAGTGQANYYMLGRATRAIQMTRGGKEGNNALIKDSTVHFDGEEDFVVAIQNNVDISLLQKIVLKGYTGEYYLLGHVHVAVRNGHRHLAGYMIKEFGGQSMTNFNELHREVLLNNTQNLKTFRAVSVKKKGQDNRNITPMHCACINPNTKYMEELMKLEPDFNHPDLDFMRSTHYAAICDGEKPLQLLLSKGASPFDVDKQGNTPLHHAARVGRSANIKLLLDNVKQSDNELAILKQRNRDGFAPLHLAAKGDHLDAVKQLLAYGADVEFQASAPRGKVNALMIACQQGHYEMAQYLVETGNSIVNKRDKLKRTPLVHAVMNGMAHVASYLLRLGADANLPDSSGNSPTHYAAAYGWHFCLKLLMEAGADLNSPNDWHLTPLAVAYMKGHMGLADQLLQQQGVDIDCRDEKGMTLAALTLTAGINPSTLQQLTYLIKDKKSSCVLKDSMGNSLLHHLAMTTADPGNGGRGLITQADIDAASKLVLENAQLLLSHGAEPDVLNDSQKTALDLAIETGKIGLAQLLCDEGSSLMPPSKTASMDGDDSVLHVLVKRGMQTGNAQPSITHGQKLAPLFKAMVKRDKETVSTWLSLRDQNGFTPVILACSLHSKIQWDRSWQYLCDNLPSLVQDNLEMIRHMVAEFPSILSQQVGKAVEKLVKDINNEEEDEECESDYDSDGEPIEKPQKPSTQPVTAGASCFHLALQQHPEDIIQAADNFPLLNMLLRAWKFAQLPNRAEVLDAKDSFGNSALMSAIQNGKPAAALTLIKNSANPNFLFSQPPKESDDGKSDSTKAKTVSNVTVLMAAIDRNLAAVAKALIDQGANVFAQDSQGNSLLHYAARAPTALMADIIKMLLNAGAIKNVHNLRQRTPLHLACNADTGLADISTEPAELLIDEESLGRADVRGRIPLHYVFVKIGNHKESSAIDPIAMTSIIVKAMLAQGSGELLHMADKFGQTPLHCAARRGANICCMTLMHHQVVRSQIDVKDQRGNTPLALAVHYGHQACALTLIQANASLQNAVTVWNSTKYESTEDHVRSAKWKWAPLRDEPPKFTSITIPNAIVRNEWQGVVYVVMDLLGNDKTALYSLVQAAIEHSSYNLALTLIQIVRRAGGFHQTSDHVKPEDLFTALAKQRFGDNELPVKVAEALIDSGIQWCSQNRSPAVLEAISSHNFGMLKFFESKHPKWSELILNLNTEVDGLNSFTAFFVRDIEELEHKSCQEWLMQPKRTATDVNCLLQLPEIADVTDRLGRIDRVSQRTAIQTPLIAAIRAQKFNLCKFLINSARADINQADNEGVTPLMHAIQVNNMDIVKLLLNHNYEVEKSEEEDANRMDNDDQTVTETRALFGGAIPAPTSQYSGRQDAAADEEEGGSDEEMEQDDEEDEDYDDDEQPSTSRKRKARAARPSKAAKRKRKQPRLTAKKGGKNHAKRPFSMTSNLDLSAVDQEGKSALNWLISPFAWGSWANVELAKLLIKCGAPRSHPVHNQFEDALLKYASARGQKQLLEVLSDGRYGGEVQFMTYEAGSDSYQVRVDIDADAKDFLDADAKRRAESRSDKDIAGKLQPNSNSGYAQTGEIVTSNNGKPFSVLMNKVDVEYGAYGTFNFYRMQLIRRKGSQLYILFTNWGRIGDTGQYQKTPFSSQEEGEKEFCKIFKAKSGNDWSNVGNFQEVPNKYQLVRQDLELMQAGNIADLKISLDFKRQSTEEQLPEETVALLKDISNVAALVDNTKRVYRNGLFLAPFGRLERAAIMEARDVLRELAKTLSDLEKLREDFSKHKNVEKVKRLMQEQAQLSNRFYQLLPFGGFQHQQLPVIDERHLLDAFEKAVCALLEFETAGKILAAAAQTKDMHPALYIYRALRCDLLSAPSPDVNQAILHYISNTSPNLRVMGIREVRHYGHRGVTRGRDNRKLLWHGTSAVNLLSILKLGLLPAPPMAMHTGHMFGQGIYTSDAHSKSYNYCESSTSGHNYTLLCEVGLGRVKELIQLGGNLDFLSPLPKGFDSIKGIGEEGPNPQYDVTLPTGVKIPLGEMVAQSSPDKNKPWLCLGHNEYIVYDPAQIVIRYLVVTK